MILTDYYYKKYLDNLDGEFDAQLPGAKNAINLETEQNTTKANTSYANSTQYEVKQNSQSQNQLTKKFFGKRWQKIMWGIIIFYFLIIITNIKIFYNCNINKIKYKSLNHVTN